MGDAVELVGRREERAALEGAFHRALQGQRTVVSIRGEAGIGKSALLGEVRLLARANGVAVVWTSVTEAESGIGWGGLATLLHGLSPALIEGRHPTHTEALRAVMGAGDTTALQPLAVAAALADVLRHLTDAGPAVVAVDDLHWLDAASAGALSFALRLLADAPLLFVVASRPVRLPIELARVVDADDLFVVEPSPLSVAGVRELLIDKFDVQLGRVELVRLHTATGGNPLHLISTGRLLHAGTPFGEALLPASLRDIIDVELRRVAAVHLAVLGAAALMPQPRLGLLRHLFDTDAVDAAISAAEAIDLVRINGDMIAFRHPLLNAGLADRLTTAERRGLHRRCSELNVTDEVRAFHVSEAAEGVDPVAADLLDAAADAATDRGLFANALVHAERALTLTDPADTGLVRRRTIRVADVAIDSGEARRALALLSPLLDGADVEGPDWAQVLQLAAFATASVHGMVAALPMLEQLALIHPVGSVARADAIGRVATALLPIDIGRTAHVCAEAEAAALAAGDLHLAQVAAAARVIADTLAGRPTEPSRAEPAAAVSMSVLLDWFAIAVWTDDHERAEQLYQEGRRRLAARPTVTHEHNLLNQAADLRLRQGRLDEAAALAERALVLADAIDHGGARSSDVAVIAALRGELEVARRHAAWASSVGDALPPVLLAQTKYGVGVVEALAGNLRSALVALREAVTMWDKAGALDLGALPLRSELAEVLLLTGEVDEAEALVTRMQELAEVAGRPRGRAEAVFASAHLLAARGQLDEAAIQADIAIAAYQALDLPVYRARALMMAGSIARRRRLRTHARVLLDEAVVLFTECGAAGYLPRVQAELSRLGERSGPDQLTATEQQIAVLVAAGQTTHEVAASLFVSRRTVESHLTRIYRKLNVRSRAELAARYQGR